MKVLVKKHDLLDQLPKDLRYLLIASTDCLPDRFVFDGVTPAQMSEHEEKREMFKTEYSNVHVALTPTQWEMFCDLLEKPNGVSKTSFYKYSTSTYDSMNAENNLAVQMKLIRQSLKSFSLPFSVEGVRKTHFVPGKYILKPL